MRRPADWPAPPVAAPGIARYSTQQITPEDGAAVLDALRSPYLTQGPYVERFEQALAEYVGAKYAVAVSSGTAALHLAYWAACRYGWNILTSPLSFVATANAALLSNCNVGFADVDAATGNLDVADVSAIKQRDFGGHRDEADLRKRGLWDMLGATARIDVVVPVHFAGRAARADYPGRLVIEDACHALGAMDFDGCSRVGSCAHSLATVFSFHPVKPITTGEGGAITTNDQGLAERLRSLRAHGRDGEGLMRELGLNYRMSEIQAALGRSQLKRCDKMLAHRLNLVSKYNDRLWPIANTQVLHYSPIAQAWWRTDGTMVRSRSAWHLYPVRIRHGRRDEVKAKLNAAGIGAQVHYSPTIPLQPYYRERCGYQPGCFPNAEAWAAEELSLPLHAGMTEGDVATVCAALAEALR